MSQPTETRISALRLDFQPLAQAWKEMVESYMLPLRFPGYRIRILETLRSGERQAELQASGASRLRVGLHQAGRAFDFAVFDERGVYLTDDSTGAYTACGYIAEALGCQSGAFWPTFKDYGHVQYLGRHKTVHQALVEAGLET